MHIPPSGTTQHTLHAWIAHLNNKCVGHIHMQRESKKRLKFLDAWVHPNYRRQGIYRNLWDLRWEYVQKHYNTYIAYAWALPMSIGLLRKKGFKTDTSGFFINVKSFFNPVKMAS